MVLFQWVLRSVCVDSRSEGFRVGPTSNQSLWDLLTTLTLGLETSAAGVSPGGPMGLLRGPDSLQAGQQGPTVEVTLTGPWGAPVWSDQAGSQVWACIWLLPQGLRRTLAASWQGPPCLSEVRGEGSGHASIGRGCQQWFCCS